MYFLLDKKIDETFTINFIGSEKFAPKNNLTLSMPECVKGITKITSYTDTTVGETETVYLKKFFRYKYSTDENWSETLPIEEITEIELCKRKCLLIELIYYRLDDGGDNNDVEIILSNVSIGGEYELTKSDSQIVLSPDDPTQILELGDALKIFSIDDFQVISTSKYGNTFDIMYRFSQNDQLSWTEWEYLTQENISTVKWDKTRFVELQYLFKMKEGYTTPVKIYEVLLEGDFQNVSANYLKLNKYGLKESCINTAFKPSQPSDSYVVDENTGTINGKTIDSNTQQLMTENSEYQLRMNWLTNGLSCYLEGTNAIDNLEAQNKENSSNLWNPYEFEKITKWHDFLAGQIADMLGMTVEYHLTAPDGGGIDKVLHEQQLHNIIDYKFIKVLVPDNQFQDNQIMINQFNLDLFDTFKVHILKTDFKEIFGVTKRPRQKDILYFCQTNRLYQIKHSQVHKDVMNAGIYYDVVLEKYEERANVLNRVEESNTRIEDLTRNTTIDELFGFDEQNEYDKIANKLQMKPKSFDFIRSIINPRTIINKESVYNGDIKVIESFYNLNNVSGDENAVEYTKADNTVLKSDNRSFIFWFNFPNEYSEERYISKKMIEGYDIDDSVFNLLNNMDDDGSLGYSLWYQSDKIYFRINEQIYSMPVEIITNIWYGIIINLDQRKRKLSMNLYRRNTAVDVVLYHPTTYEKLELDLDEDIEDIEYEMNVNGFRAVDNIEVTATTANPTFIEMDSYEYNDIEPAEFTHENNLSISGSKMLMTNIRVFDDLIGDDYKKIILNELIVKDSQHLILADNANKKLDTTNYPNKQWR